MMKALLRDRIRDVTARARISLGGQANLKEVRQILDALTDARPLPLQRLGGSGDGAYWVPQDLSRVTRVFSPGVSEQVSFDLNLAMAGIPVSMLDPTVSGPPLSHDLFSFRRLGLAAYTSSEHGLIGLSDWFEQEMGIQQGQALLQMDIEGDEYIVVPSVSDEILQRFDVCVLEFHFLHHLMSANGFRLMMPALSRLLDTMIVVASVSNETCGSFRCCGSSFPRMLEVTFVHPRYFS